MANIELNGNTYSNVPYVDLPTTSQTTARFWEDVLKMGVLRNDAELVQTWSKDSLFVADDHGTIPAYSTSATTIAASVDLTPTYTINYTNYNYYALVRALTIPIYNTATKEKGIVDYSVLSGCVEVVEFPQNTFRSLDGSKTFTSSSANAISAGAAYRMLYWSSATAISVYTSSSYGIQQIFAAPAFASGVMTAKSPSLQFRGSTTYLTSSAWGKITDIRVQYVIELYRAPKNHLNLDGWGIYTQGRHVVDCVNSTNHNLT